MSEIKSGFIAVVGRPNAGKSSLINAILNEKISLVSKKANATRKRSLAIHMYKENQLIFIDTPGIHEKERLLNKFMLDEALKAMGDCDLILFLAPASDKTTEYEKFLAQNKKDIPHILVLTKTDTISNAELLQSLSNYQKFQDNFKALIPVNTKKAHTTDILCDEIIKYLPVHPYLYDTDILTTQNLKELYKEFIRESIFENTSEEIPYFADVVVNSVHEDENLYKVFADIIVEKKSQKAILIGKNGAALKRVGMNARRLMEQLSGVKIFLKLQVKVKANWSKDKKELQKFGYYIDT